MSDELSKTLQDQLEVQAEMERRLGKLARLEQAFAWLQDACHVRLSQVFNPDGWRCIAMFYDNQAVGIAMTVDEAILVAFADYKSSSGSK